MYVRLFWHTRANHADLYGQHGNRLVTEEGIGYINITTRPCPTPPIHSPIVTPLYNPPQLCERGSQRHLRPPIFLTIYNGLRSACAYRHFTSTGSAMEDVDYPKWDSFCNSFCTAAHEISWYSLLVKLPPKIVTEQSGMSSVDTWNSIPYSSCKGIRWLSSTPSQGSATQEPLHSADVRYDTARLRTA